MKVCVICSTFPPQRSGQKCGIGDYTIHLSRGLVSLGFEIVILTSTLYTGPRVLDPNLAVFPLIRNWNTAALKVVRSFLDVQRCSLVSLQYQPNMYGKRWSFFNALLPIVTKSQSRKLVTTFHSIANPSPVSPTRLSALLLAACSDHIIVTNEHHLSELLRLYGPAARKLSCVPVGANILPSDKLWGRREHVRIGVRARLGISQDEVLLSHFGLIYQGKGLETLLKAMRLLLDSGRDVRLLIFGHVRPTAESYCKSLAMFAEKLGIEDHIIWTRDCTENEISEYLLASDIYVVPYDDGISSRRTSSMVGFAHGLPIVSTSSPTIPPIFKSGQNVILVPPKDGTALFRALVELVDSAERRTAIGIASLQLAQQFSWPLISRAIADVCSQVADRR